MRTLTGLSGNYVTFDQSVRECNFVFEFLSSRKNEHLTWKINGFDGLAALFGKRTKEKQNNNSCSENNYEEKTTDRSGNCQKPLQVVTIVPLQSLPSNSHEQGWVLE